jgi:hypothetical protein
LLASNGVLLLNGSSVRLANRREAVPIESGSVRVFPEVQPNSTSGGCRKPMTA